VLPLDQRKASSAIAHSNSVSNLNGRSSAVHLHHQHHHQLTDNNNHLHHQQQQHPNHHQLQLDHHHRQQQQQQQQQLQELLAQHQQQQQQTNGHSPLSLTSSSVTSSPSSSSSSSLSKVERCFVTSRRAVTEQQPLNRQPSKLEVMDFTMMNMYKRKAEDVAVTVPTQAQPQVYHHPYEGLTMTMPPAYAHHLVANVAVTTATVQPPVKRMARARLGYDFFDIPPLELAKKMLGMILVRLQDGVRVSGRIVETEAYLGAEDKATPGQMGWGRKAPPPSNIRAGMVQLFTTYGRNTLTVACRGDGAMVLIRAIEPLEGIDEMRRNRGSRRQDQGKGIELNDLCNGPPKVCQALQIERRTTNQQDLVISDYLWLEEGERVPETDVVFASRIAVDNAGDEWAKKPWRVYIFGNTYVSHLDVEAERAQGKRPA